MSTNKNDSQKVIIDVVDNIHRHSAFHDFEEDNISDIQTAFMNSLNERKQEEIRRCQSCVGPHRDDIIFYINNQEAVKFASQGQQRTIVLALKLAELDIITDKTGDNPMFLPNWMI